MGQTTLFDLSNVDQILSLTTSTFNALPSLATEVDQSAIKGQLAKVLSNQQSAAAVEGTISTTLSTNNGLLSTLITDTNNSITLVEALIQAIGQQFATFAKLDVQEQQLGILNKLLSLFQGSVLD